MEKEYESEKLVIINKSKFKNRYSATIGSDFKCSIQTDGDYTLTLQFWDTAGQERYDQLSKSFLRGPDGVFLIYDVTSQRSFDKLQHWLSIVRYDTSYLPVVLVGNKIDLDRVVTTASASQWAEANNCLWGGEVSCKENIGIGEAYGMLYAEIYLESLRIPVAPVPVLDLVSDEIVYQNSCCSSVEVSTKSKSTTSTNSIPQIKRPFTRKILAKILVIGEYGVGKTTFATYEDFVTVNLSEIRRLNYNPFIITR